MDIINMILICIHIVSTYHWIYIQFMYSNIKHMEIQGVGEGRCAGQYLDAKGYKGKW